LSYDHQPADKLVFRVALVKFGRANGTNAQGCYLGICVQRASQIKAARAPGWQWRASSSLGACRPRFRLCKCRWPGNSERCSLHSA